MVKVLVSVLKLMQLLLSGTSVQVLCSFPSLRGEAILGVGGEEGKWWLIYLNM